MTIEMKCVVLEEIAEAYDYARLTPEAKMVLNETSGTFASLEALLNVASGAQLSSAEVHRALWSLCVERRLRKDSGRYYGTAEGSRVVEKIEPIEWVVESVEVSDFCISDTETCLMPALTATLLNVSNKHNTLKVELVSRPYGEFVVHMPKAKAVEGHEVAISSAIFNTLKQIFYWRDNA